MSRGNEGLGVFTALGVVLILMGLAFLAAYYLGVLPQF